MGFQHTNPGFILGLSMTFPRFMTLILDAKQLPWAKSSPAATEVVVSPTVTWKKHVEAKMGWCARAVYRSSQRILSGYVIQKYAIPPNTNLAPLLPFLLHHLLFLFLPESPCWSRSEQRWCVALHPPSPRNLVMLQTLGRPLSLRSASRAWRGRPSHPPPASQPAQRLRRLVGIGVCLQRSLYPWKKLYLGIITPADHHSSAEWGHYNPYNFCR